MKKFISLACVFSILACSFSFTAYAVDISSQDKAVEAVTGFAPQEPNLKPYESYGENFYAKATNGTDVAERIGNVIYINGEKFATIHVTNNTGVEPRSGWITQENCLYGTTPSDYTKLISSRDIDVNFEKGIVANETAGFAILISELIPEFGVATAVAAAIINAAVDSKYAYAKTVYFHEIVKGHKDFPNLWQQVNCTYYFDQAHTQYATSGTYYQSWA